MTKRSCGGISVQQGEERPHKRRAGQALNAPGSGASSIISSRMAVQ